MPFFAWLHVLDILVVLLYNSNVVGVWRRLVARYLGVVEAVGSSPVTPTSRKVRKHAVYGLFSLPENSVCPLPVHYCPEDAFCPQPVLISCIFLSLPSGSGGGVSFLEKSRTFAIASLALALASWNACKYMLVVVLMAEWPNALDTVATSMPLLMRAEA